MILHPGSCRAVRIGAILEKRVERVEVTPEWRAENAEKQARYEAKFAAWRKEHPPRANET